MEKLWLHCNGILSSPPCLCIHSHHQVILICTICSIVEMLQARRQRRLKQDENTPIMHFYEEFVNKSSTRRASKSTGRTATLQQHIRSRSKEMSKTVGKSQSTETTRSTTTDHDALTPATSMDDLQTTKATTTVPAMKMVLVMVVVVIMPTMTQYYIRVRVGKRMDGKLKIRLTMPIILP